MDMAQRKTTILIGHNNPPKERKVNYKSISIHKIAYEELQRIGKHILNHKNCYLLLDGKKPLENLSIPYVIDMLTTNYYLDHICPSIQENGRDIWEQTAKSLLRKYNSKKGLKINETK
jgi:hypothetical protein|tara:strand:- start:18 stop:371 length:354 start_codon:yes stop_codon:yes gene_type:complete